MKAFYKYRTRSELFTVGLNGRQIRQKGASVTSAAEQRGAAWCIWPIMSRGWSALAICCILASASTAHSYKVLTVITPGPQSHAFGMRRITEEMQSRGLSVMVCALLLLLVMTQP